MKKRIMVFILVFFALFSVEASMISFSVIETGLPQDGRTSQHTILWENTLLDVFFNAGHIVCNAPIQRLESRPPADFLSSSFYDLEREAIDGGIDYIILVQLDYPPDLETPSDISILLYKVRGRVKIYEKQLRGKAYRTIGEETDDLKIIIRELLPYFNN